MEILDVITMQVPFNNTARVFRSNKKEILAAIEMVAESGWWLSGDCTRKFSEDFARLCGTKFCLPVANGTDALELSLRALLGDQSSTEPSEVITVANAGGYSTTACRLAGAIPVYADIVRDTQLICLDSFARCLGPRIKAVILTHLYGGVVDVLKVRRILEKNGHKHISIIEDCAQAHGARLVDQRVGSLGDLATFSFYPTKNLGAMGDAGAITTSNESLYQRLRSLHQYGWREKYHTQIPYGRNSRMDEMQAAILTTLLPHLDDNNNRRKAIVDSYKKAAPSSMQFLNHGNADYVAHLAVARTNDRAGFLEHMKLKGVKVDIHYPVLDCDQIAWKTLPHRIDEESALRVSQNSVEQVVSLPCFPHMSDSEISQTCEALSLWESL